MSGRVKKVRALFFLPMGPRAHHADFRYRRQPARISFYYHGYEWGYNIMSWNRVLASCGAWGQNRVTHFQALRRAMAAFALVFCMCEKRYSEARRNEQP